MARQQEREKSKEIQEAKVENLEINPFQKMENEAAESIVGIDKDTQRFVGDFLEEETVRKQKEFALKYFEDNEADIRNERKDIPKNPSSDQIIDVVLRSRENGGMGALAEINKKSEDIKNPDYKKIREEMDRIGVLRSGMKTPEVPFLWLSYLQESVDRIKGEIETLEDSKDKEDKAMAVSKKNQLERLNSARVEIAEKITGEDLRGNAEKTVEQKDYYTPEQKYIREQIVREEKAVADKKDNELLNKEWEYFSSLGPKEKQAYLKKIGYDGSIYIGIGEFGQNMKRFAENYDSGKEAFYKLLEQDYKPHLREKRGWFWNRKVVMPKSDGTREEKSLDEYNDLARRAKRVYIRDVVTQAKEKLANKWRKQHEEDINDKIEEYIEEIAESLDSTKGGVREAYKKAKEKITEGLERAA